jgi:hypothetical protein
MHEGSDLINGLIHWWVHNLNGLLGGGEIVGKWSLVGGSKSLETSWSWSLPVTLSFLGEELFSTTPFLHDILPQLRPRNMEVADLGLKPLNL